ncbi:hypothetical protein ACJX0J_021513, partial [Zea mays]
NELMGNKEQKAQSLMGLIFLNYLKGLFFCYKQEAKHSDDETALVAMSLESATLLLGETPRKAADEEDGLQSILFDMTPLGATEEDTTSHVIWKMRSILLDKGGGGGGGGTNGMIGPFFPTHKGINFQKSEIEEKFEKKIEWISLEEDYCGMWLWKLEKEEGLQALIIVIIEKWKLLSLNKEINVNWALSGNWNSLTFRRRLVGEGAKQLEDLINDCGRYWLVMLGVIGVAVASFTWKWLCGFK